MTKFFEENDELLKDVLAAYDKFEYSDHGNESSANASRTSILELTKLVPDLLGFPEEDVVPLWLNQDNSSPPSNVTTEEDPEEATDISETTTLKAEELDVNEEADDRLGNATETETTQPYRTSTEANNVTSSIATSTTTVTSTETTTTSSSTTTSTKSSTSDEATSEQGSEAEDVDTYSADSATTTTSTTTTTTTPGPSRAGDPLIDTSGGPTAAIVGATLTGMGIVGLLLGTEFSTINRCIVNLITSLLRSP
jgi:hypothetical protein